MPAPRTDWARRLGSARSPGPGALLGALMAACGTMLLAGCGSTSHTSVRTGTGASDASAESCRQVPTPPSRDDEHASPPTEHLDSARRYTVTLATNCGDIAIQLAVKEAPITTASFASLVRQGFYNGLTFHRVVPGYVIQGGDPKGNGTGGPGYSVVERPPSGLRYSRGVVAMAKTGSDPSGTSGSQFFIVTAPDASLPAQYALVGTVVGGEAAIEAIERVPRTAGPDGEESAPSMPVVIEKATLVVN